MNSLHDIFMVLYGLDCEKFCAELGLLFFTLLLFMIFKKCLDFTLMS